MRSAESLAEAGVGQPQYVRGEGDPAVSVGDGSPVDLHQGRLHANTTDNKLDSKSEESIPSPMLYVAALALRAGSLLRWWRKADRHTEHEQALRGMS